MPGAGESGQSRFLEQLVDPAWIKSNGIFKEGAGCSRPAQETGLGATQDHILEPEDYEIDHRIPLPLGGSNSI